MGIKTIDVQAKEWVDKQAGNSYFSAKITINHGLVDERQINLPFQYGHGDQIIVEAFEAIKKAESINTDVQCWQYCKDKGIVFRHNTQRNCRWREVVSFGKGD